MSLKKQIAKTAVSSLPLNKVQPQLTTAERVSGWPAVRRLAASDAALKADAGSLAIILCVFEERVGEDKKLSCGRHVTGVTKL